MKILTAVLFSSLLACAVAAQAPIFKDVAESSGLDFVHWNGMTGELFFVEMTGQGSAVFDYDNDGDLDVYLVQGAPLVPEGKEAKKPLEPFPGEGAPRDRLFRNDLDQGKGLRFTDVTTASGLQATGYGMGVATGDFDNDGFIDLFVTNYGPNQLWRNRGDGTFENVTAKSGTAGSAWSTSAAVFDYDADGRLDLYVANYVDYKLEENSTCYATSSRPDYCGPQTFPPQADLFLRNRGDGTFEDVTRKVLTSYESGPGLGVLAADLNGDRRVDLYVANDGAANQLWIQGEDGTFFDDALLAGVAVNRAGQPEASMGIDAGDADGNGHLDLVLAHLMGETNTIYLADGQGLFNDLSTESGLGAPSFAFTAFGAGFLDYDNDGWLDLLTLNGAVKILEELVREGNPFPLDQTNQLFRNLGRGPDGRVRFEEVTARAGAVFEIAEVSRGAAFGDLDNDGDVDVVVNNNNGRARLLLNEVGASRPWLGLRLLDGKRDALGALVMAHDKEPKPVRRVRTDGSYCSAHDPRVLIGLGALKYTGAIRVDWPDGKTETWQDIPQRTYTTLRKGSGKPVP